MEHFTHDSLYFADCLKVKCFFITSTRVYNLMSMNIQDGFTSTFYSSIYCGFFFR